MSSHTIAKPRLQQLVRKRLFDVFARLQNMLCVVATSHPYFRNVSSMPHAIDAGKFLAVLDSQVETFWNVRKPFTTREFLSQQRFTFTGSHYVCECRSENRIRRRPRQFLHDFVEFKSFFVFFQPWQQRHEQRHREDQNQNWIHSAKFASLF